MQITVAERVSGVYELAHLLPRRDHLTPSQSLPLDGLYLFFERSELAECSGRTVDRIVRVGTHRVNGRFRKRILQHYGRVSSLGGNMAYPPCARWHAIAFLSPLRSAELPATIEPATLQTQHPHTVRLLVGQARVERRSALGHSAAKPIWGCAAPDYIIRSGTQEQPMPRIFPRFGSQEVGPAATNASAIIHEACPSANPMLLPPRCRVYCFRIDASVQNLVLTGASR